ncbi:HET-domain-containing protein [Trametes versicolor FP-101664 SS1]|uniref:HET-domain-containing protein n=1 Tax=Trametes versicolor (strain FP-101664) TaxID=717944 RepID=UPI000462447F|nr:HET-domain-containing protein [Trametes versicolor FP-101664 SS1]EIW59567.1 HET-domain-containing protein [Trametes versicolor FP-101664 SS1]
MDGEHIDGLCIYTAPDDLAASYITTRSPILTDVKSPCTLVRARQLINQCIDKHELCKAATSLSPRLPTRLVDCTDLAHPRLVSTPGRQHGEYLALSYVWGQDPEQTRYRATTLNLSTYGQEINPRLLPPTIRDAIYVTHQLGFRWLWVDSLCIIQDSDEDKAHEIGRMHHIYRYAHVTIMAASAEGVGSGFLQKRAPPDDFVLGLPFICPPYPQNTSQKLQVGQVYLTRGSDVDTSHGDELGFMARRAWCMQEYLLSPRALIFAPSTLLFRCLTADAAGVGSSGYSIEHDLRIPTSLFLPRTAPAAEPNSKEWEEMCEAWMNVVWDYTRRTASEESDKLVACAAVAEQFHFVLGSEYLAGLWRSDTLLIRLLWKADKSTAASLGCRHTRPTAYRAPSWSWAAIDGPAFYDSIYPLTSLGYRQHVALAEVAGCWVTVKDPALPFGRVTDGALGLRGTLVLCHGRAAEKSHYSDWWTIRVRALPTFEQVRRQWQRGLRGLISDEADGMYSTNPGGYASVIMDDDVDELPEKMWLVPFLRTKSTSNNDVQGIALQLAPPSNGSGSAPEKIRFRRIGYFVNFVKGARPGKAYMEHPLWDPLTRAVKMGEPPWVDIEII